MGPGARYPMSSTQHQFLSAALARAERRFRATGARPIFPSLASAADDPRKRATEEGIKAAAAGARVQVDSWRGGDLREWTEGRSCFIR